MPFKKFQISNSKSQRTCNLTSHSSRLSSRRFLGFIIYYRKYTIMDIIKTKLFWEGTNGLSNGRLPLEQRDNDTAQNDATYARPRNNAGKRITEGHTDKHRENYIGV